MKLVYKGSALKLKNIKSVALSLTWNLIIKTNK